MSILKPPDLIFHETSVLLWVRLVRRRPRNSRNMRSVTLPGCFINNPLIVNMQISIIKPPYFQSLIMFFIVNLTCLGSVAFLRSGPFCHTEDASDRGL